MKKYLTVGSYWGILATEVPSSLISLAYIKLTHKIIQYSSFGNQNLIQEAQETFGKSLNVVRSYPQHLWELIVFYILDQKKKSDLNFNDGWRWESR